MVYFTLAGTADSAQAGQIVALDANSGEAVWTHTMEQPAPSSPAILFAADEAGLLLQADGSGKLTLLDAKTGEALDSLETGSPIDASPALFGNIAVMGGTDGKVVAALIK